MSGETALAHPQAITLEALEASFDQLSPGALSGAGKDFLRQAWEDYAADETPELGGRDLAGLLAMAWRGAEGRAHGEPARITLSPLHGVDGVPLGYDVLIVIQDDRPFLVDSVMGELADAGVTVRSMYHPVTAEDGGRESTIIVVMDPLPQERRDALGEGVALTLKDVSSAVDGHADMAALMHRSIAHLEANPHGVAPDILAEHIDFLKWLEADHFVFLGARDYDYPRSSDGGYEAEAPLSQAGVGLGVLADPARTVLRRANEPAVLTKSMKKQLDLSEPVTVGKANVRSRVHRRAYMDYIGVKRFGPDGRPSGETRFVGLFTAEAYDKTATQVPLVRLKVANALTAKSGSGTFSKTIPATNSSRSGRASCWRSRSASCTCTTVRGSRPSPVRTRSTG